MTGWHLIIPILSAEVFWWGCVLNAHARLMKELGEKDCMANDSDICFRKNWIRVYMASVMATALSMGVMLWWGVMWWTGKAEAFVYPQWVAAGIQLSHIHFFSIIARCTCLDVDDWPWLSRLKSKCLHRCGIFVGEEGE